MILAQNWPKQQNPREVAPFKFESKFRAAKNSRLYLSLQLALNTQQSGVLAVVRGSEF